MDLSRKIAKWRYEVAYWTRTLNDMPADTVVGRLCAEYYLRRAQRKLNEALEEQNNSNT